MRRGAGVLAAVLLISCGLAAPAAAQTTEPPRDDHPPRQRLPETWLLRDVVGAPSWLRFALEHRARFEHLENDFRAGATGDATAMMFRTSFSAEARITPVFVGAELADSRAYATDDTRLDTTHVNALELLRAYVGLRREGLFVRDDEASLTVGRLTLDLGSRRLVARNSFRNTINAFTGVEGRWVSPGDHTLRAIAVWPIQRRPDDPEAIDLNRIELDRENTDAILGGFFFGSAPLRAELRLEAYVLGFFERDGVVATQNRRLVTTGARVLRAPAAGRLDLELEAMVQLGASRASRAEDDRRDLTHRAGALHVSAGRSFEVPWTPRLAAGFDFASGDDDPDDGFSGRFDTLFGARRWEYGPTGIYGAIARANVGSPFVRIEVAPHAAVDAFVAYRPVWLASARDAWTPASLRDRTGASGSFVGNQIEGSLRWRALPKHLSLEIGAAGLVPGRFATTAPEAPSSRGARAAPIYVYSQLVSSL